jgi:hypothetical protein
MVDATLTAARLREVLHYDPDAGAFTWRPGFGGNARSGRSAGSVSKLGYIRIYVDGRQYRSARLAFLYMTGDWPEGHVDHINGQRTQNQWINLRDVPHWMNQQNHHRARKDNKSTGLLGVTCYRGAFEAQIQHNGKRHYLGKFATPGEAHSAYLKAKRKLHAGCTI